MCIFFPIYHLIILEMTAYLMRKQHSVHFIMRFAEGFYKSSFERKLYHHFVKTISSVCSLKNVFVQFLEMLSFTLFLVSVRHNISPLTLVSDKSPDTLSLQSKIQLIHFSSYQNKQEHMSVVHLGITDYDLKCADRPEFLNLN